MVINIYSIYFYWFLLMYIILLNIDGNVINGYWWLNYHSLLVAILLMVIILMAIGGYFKLYYNY
jgi:hypothetical protein